MQKKQTKDRANTGKKLMRNKDTLGDLTPTAKQVKGVKGGGNTIPVPKGFDSKWKG